MGLTVNHTKMIEQFNLELPNFYAAISGQVQVVKQYRAGAEALQPAQYFVYAQFGVWPNKEACKSKATPMATDRTFAGPFDEAPTGNVYELIYEKYKSQWRYFVDDL
jgi:hypothetical protein